VSTPTKSQIIQTLVATIANALVAEHLVSTAHVSAWAPVATALITALAALGIHSIRPTQDPEA
jgi:hypothetical protein